jgi:phospholipid-binding lipoprotein MlaA
MSAASAAPTQDAAAPQDPRVASPVPEPVVGSPDTARAPQSQHATTSTTPDAVPAAAPADTTAAADASDATDASAQSTASTPSTAAEADFDALYGAPSAADGAPVGPPGAYDPWEPYNRRMHRFNNAVDRRVAKPLATAYVKVVPRPIRSGVSNFFSNLGQPASAVNALLQGRPKQAAHSLGRFLLNSTLGIGGIFDPATDAHLDNRNEDFGQTLGVWGWKRSRYVELPLFGPRTLRDVVGMAGDAPLSPMRQVEADRIRVPLQGLQLVDLRMQLMSTDAMREGAADDYALVRDAWMQRRAYQIDGDRAADDGIPDYLKDDPNMVPVDAMPVSGGH